MIWVRVDPMRYKHLFNFIAFDPLSESFAYRCIDAISVGAVQPEEGNMVFLDTESPTCIAALSPPDIDVFVDARRVCDSTTPPTHDVRRTQRRRAPLLRSTSCGGSCWRSPTFRRRGEERTRLRPGSTSEPSYPVRATRAPAGDIDRSRSSHSPCSAPCACEKGRLGFGDLVGRETVFRLPVCLLVESSMSKEFNPRR